MKRVPIFTQRLKVCPYKNPYGYVYIFTNKINGHKYIGKHTFKNPYIDSKYQGSGTKHWKCALKKYGWENFEKEVLFWLEDNPDLSIKDKESILLNAERVYIYYLGTFINKSDYNESIGGDGLGSGEDHPCYGKHYNLGANNPWYHKGVPHTIESRKRMSEIKKLCIGAKNSFYGKHHTEEWKRKYRNGGNNPMARAVYKYTIDGVFIESYNCLALVPFSKYTIGDRCRLNVDKKYRGIRVPFKEFIWSYLHPIDNHIPDITEEPYYKSNYIKRSY